MADQATMQALIAALQGANPETVRQLRDALQAVPQAAAEVNPCDHGHAWSDMRKDHNGKKVGRSCKRCGVLAAITGHAHGELADDVGDEAPVAAAVAAAVGSDAPAASAPAPKRDRKKKTA